MSHFSIWFWNWISGSFFVLGLISKRFKYNKKYILQQFKNSYGNLHFQFTIVFIFMYVHIVNNVYLIMQNVTIYQVASSILTVSNEKER